MVRNTHTRGGFTVVELLVILAIVAVLSTVVLASLNGARGKSRETKRVTDLSQIQLALKLYSEANNGYPDNATYDSGVTVGEGGTLDTDLAPYLPVMPHDPLGPGDSDYRYVYDSDHLCQGDSMKVLYAVTSEDSDNYNWLAVCGAYNGTPDNETYGLIIQY